MDNYPPGAASDPRAPWNQPEWPEIDIRVEAKLVKETVVQGSGSHTVTECEIEPDGTKSYISFTESDDDVRELFDDQCRNPMKLIIALEKIIKKLQEERKLYWYAGYNLFELLADCDGWNEEELEVTEIR